MFRLLLYIGCFVLCTALIVVPATLLAQDTIYLPVVKSDTSTGVPSGTITPTATVEQKLTTVPTFTNTPTATFTPTNTPTVTPSSTPTNTPTATPSNTPTSTPTATSTPCAELKGVLESNTNLVSGCYYNVTGNLLVSEGVTLSIPSGVLLRFAPAAYMMVDGSLRVAGTDGAPVVFTRRDESFWGGVRITEKSRNLSSLVGMIFEYAQGERAPYTYAALNVINAQPKLENISFQYNVSPFRIFGRDDLPSVTLSGGQVTNNTEGSALGIGNHIIDGVYFAGNSATDTDAVISVCPGSSILNSSVVNNSTLAIEGNDCSSNGVTNIDNNTITGNRGAIAVTHNFSVTIQSNEISNNSQVSIAWPPGYRNTDATLVVTCKTVAVTNNVYDNSSIYAIRSNGTNCDITATDNWWGTTNINEIGSQIYDYYDDFTLGRIVYTPFSSTSHP